MAGAAPERKYAPINVGSVLDESVTPAKNPGLTIAQNLVYRRFGSWGKRAGSTPVYTAVLNPPEPPIPPPPAPPFNPAPPVPPDPPDPPPGPPAGQHPVQPRPIE